MRTIRPHKTNVTEEAIRTRGIASKPQNDEYVSITEDRKTAADIMSEAKTTQRFNVFSTSKQLKNYNSNDTVRYASPADSTLCYGRPPFMLKSSGYTHLFATSTVSK